MWIGTVFTCGPGTYKIPSFSDIPANLRVHLLHNAPNERAVYSSKGIGEPPLFLGSSVFFAIKDAISSVRRDNGETMNYVYLRGSIGRLLNVSFDPLNIMNLIYKKEILGKVNHKKTFFSGIFTFLKLEKNTVRVTV